MTKLPLHIARKFILHSQLLSPGIGRSGKEATLHTIKHLGYVQIDTISVIERAHHHVLWTRVPDYRPAYLQALDGEDRAVFDYWSHAASYLPMEDYRFSLVRKKSMDKGAGFWRLTDPALATHVLQRIRQEGPLMSKDFKKAKARPDEPWRIPAINMVIRQLFMQGDLMVSKRKGMQKTYDLPERVLSKGIRTAMPTRGEYIAYILRRDLRAHGLVKLSEFGHLLKVPRKEFQKALKKMVKSGEVVEVEIDGLEGGPYFAFGKAFKNFVPSNKKLFHILSPFDNLIIQRKRLAELFNFQYTLECYVPAAKRKFGYFGLPLLYGNEFVGQVDLKADRKAKVLYVRKLVWEGKPGKGAVKAFEKKLREFANFCACEDIEKG